MTELKRVFMERDGLTSDEAELQMAMMRESLGECESFDDVEDLLAAEGLELDYFDDLI